MSFLEENQKKFTAENFEKQFSQLENKGFEVIYEKICEICGVYRDFLLKVLDFRTESSFFNKKSIKFDKIQ